MADLEIFLKKYGDTQFRHSETLISELISGQAILDAVGDSSLPCKHYSYLGRKRIDHLEQFDTQHAKAIREDTILLCEELEQIPDEPCKVWSFSKAPYYDYAVYEASNLSRILGCILAVDRRLIDPKEWDLLWSK